MNSTVSFVLDILLFFARCTGFGLITRRINQKKGYDNGFAWGAWLGLLGVIIVANRKNRKQPEEAESITADAVPCEMQEPALDTVPHDSVEESFEPDPEQFVGKHAKASVVDDKQSYNEVLDAIRQLSDLYRQGILTEAEYEEKKAKLLEKI